MPSRKCHKLGSRLVERVCSVRDVRDGGDIVVVYEKPTNFRYIYITVSLKLDDVAVVQTAERRVRRLSIQIETTSAIRGQTPISTLVRTETFTRRRAKKVNQLRPDSVSVQVNSVVS